jgi:hypothetical protein
MAPLHSQKAEADHRRENDWREGWGIEHREHREHRWMIEVKEPFFLSF